METERPAEKQALYYVILVFVLSIPFWLLGEGRLPLAVNLPASALMFVCPFLAAGLLTWREGGGPGLRRWLGKAAGGGKIRPASGLALILLVVPGVYTASYLLMRLAGVSLPAAEITPGLAALNLALFFPAALAEELGWMGYALEPLQQRRGVLRAGLILGIVWALWHLIPHRQQGFSAGWIAGQSLYAILLRILIVWVYQRSGRSVLGAALMHTTDSLSWALFPRHGSHYNPWLVSLVSAALLAGLIVVGGRKGMWITTEDG